MIHDPISGDTPFDEPEEVEHSDGCQGSCCQPEAYMEQETE